MAIELMLLDDDLNVVGAIDEYDSLMWTRRYYDMGECQLVARPQDWGIVNDSKYIYRRDIEEMCVINSIQYASQAGKVSATVLGKSLEVLLADRVIDTIPPYTGGQSGTPSELMRTWVTMCAITPTDTARAIPHLAIGYDADAGSKIVTPARGSVLLTKIREVCTPQELGFRLRYNYVDNMIFAEVWQGIDRTQAQTDNAFAIFSDDFENVSTANYDWSDADERNYAYVAGEGEDAARVIVAVDQSGGAPRKELWVDARDLQRGEQTQAEYEAVLRERGLQKLAEYRQTHNANVTAIASANLVYRQDYDLGDLCTYVNGDLGITMDARLTEVTETWEGGAYSIQLVFGDTDKEIRQVLDREVK